MNTLNGSDSVPRTMPRPLSETSVASEKLQALQTVTDRSIVTFSVVYGSHTVGEATEESDIDIGLYLAEDVEENTIQTLIFRIEGEYADLGFDDMELDISILSEPNEQQFIDTVHEQAYFLAGAESAFLSWK